MRSLDFFFFNLPDHSIRTIALEMTQPLTEMSTRNHRGGGRIRCLPPLALIRKQIVSETLCFFLFLIPDDGQSSTNPAILSAIHHRQNALAAIFSP
jgi:hypothetical protein